MSVEDEPRGERAPDRDPPTLHAEAPTELPRDPLPGAPRTVGGWTRFTRPSAPPPGETAFSAFVADDASFEARYADAGLLGKGGMGEVRLCRDRRTERDVAVKRIYPTIRDEAHRARFLREARIQAQLDHPTVVPVYDMGTDADGLEFFTMKPAAGLTLAEILDGLRQGDRELSRRYTLPVRLRIFRQICQGVEYAHTRGILHRDLKPANVIIGDLGETYLIDWGIAKVTTPASDGGPAPEEDEGGLGTLGYVAPEQLRDADTVDVRADVYALGVILFELLTLDALHPDQNTLAYFESAQQASDGQPIRARLHGLDVPPELERLCIAATAVDPRKRLSSVTQLLDPVSDFLDGNRDVALRHSLAQQHADAARVWLNALLEQGDPDDQVRARALQEAGYALALDPRCEDAVQVVTQLLAKPPSTLPREAAALLEEHADFAEQQASISTGTVYLALLPLLGWLLLSVHILNWWAVVWMAAPMAFATVVVLLRARSRRDGPSLMWNVYGSLLAIGATATLGSPFAIMPGLLAGYVAVSTSYVRTAVEHPVRWAALCLTAALVPVALLAMGLLPVEMHLEPGGRIIVQHQISDASPATMYATLAGATVVAVLTPIASAYRTAKMIRELRTQLFVQMWHLRKLTST